MKRFPEYLYRPYQVLWFEVDELTILFTAFLLALMFGNLTWVLLVAGPYAYSKMKKKYPRGFLRHILYFVGIVQMTGYPNFFEDEFTE